MKGEDKMKNILFAIAIVLTLGLTANAQGRDGFFNMSDNDAYMPREGSDPSFVLPNHFDSNDNDAPLGTGLLIMTALGAGYAVARNKNRK